MLKLQDKLNSMTKPKRELSFHADKPRRAALKCKEKGFGIGLVPSSKKKTSEKPSGSSEKSSDSSEKHSGCLKTSMAVSVWLTYFM